MGKGAFNRFPRAGIAGNRIQARGCEASFAPQNGSISASLHGEDTYGPAGGGGVKRQSRKSGFAAQIVAAVEGRARADALTPAMRAERELLRRGAGISWKQMWRAMARVINRSSWRPGRAP